MLAKTLCIIFMATLSVSLAKEDDLVNTILTAGTNIMKESAKAFSDEPEKYSVDLNALYKKNEVEEKANQARSYLLTQFKLGIEKTIEYLKQSDIQNEENIKKRAEILKKEDPVLGEKAYKMYEKMAEYHRASEDIIKYVLEADKIDGYFDEKIASLKPYEQKLAEIVKNFESGVVEVIKKGKKV